MEIKNAAANIYDECVKRGIPTANHYSDLYIPYNEETRELVEFYVKHTMLAQPTTFRNQIEGGLWYDLAFQFMPYWREREVRDSGK